MRNIKDLKKRFSVISASVLMLLGGTAAAFTHMHVNADSSNDNQQDTIKIQNVMPNHVQDSPYKIVHPKRSTENINSEKESQNVMDQTNQLHNAIIIQHLFLDFKNNVNNNNQSSLTINESRTYQTDHGIQSNNASSAHQQANEDSLVKSGQLNRKATQRMTDRASASLNPKSMNHQPKIGNLQLQRNARALLNDLNWISNHPVDNQNLNSNDEMNYDSILDKGSHGENTSRNK